MYLEEAPGPGRKGYEMRRERTISKIKKLLEVTETRGATEAEAVAAALAAQKLIAEESIEDWELADKTEPIVTAEARRGRRWQSMLASVIAENFRCRNYVSYIPEGKSRRSVYECFHGHRRDAEAAKLVFERLSEVGNREGRRYAKAKVAELEGLGFAPDRGAIFNTWALSFVNGVKGELEKQCTALMLAVPRDVSDSFDDIVSGARKERRRRADVYDDPSIREDGTSAGRDAVRAGRVATRESHLIEG